MRNKSWNNNMRSLRDFQDEMARVVTRHVDAEKLSCLWGDDVTVAARVNVYRNNYKIGHEQALAAIYPAIQRIVGNEYFRYLAREYSRQYPSMSGNIHHLGKHLSQFLTTIYSLASLPYLQDVARLEWAYHELLHSRAGHPIPPAKLRRLALLEDGLINFKAQAVLQMLASDYPILTIWQVNNNDAMEVPPIDLGSGKNYLLLYRVGERVGIADVTRDEFEFVNDLCVGISLNEALQRAAEGIDVAKLLAFCIAETIFEDVEIGKVT